MCPPQTPHGLPRGPACTRGMAGIAGSLLILVRCGIAERRIVFQFTGTPERPSLFLGTINIVFNKCGGLLPWVLGARCEVTTYFSQLARLSKRGAMSPLPTCIRI